MPVTTEAVATTRVGAASAGRAVQTDPSTTARRPPTMTSGRPTRNAAESASPTF
jgi:hypothetical protein